jgi:hypothetical protein
MDPEIEELFLEEQARLEQITDWFLITQYEYEGTWFLE